MTKSVHIIEHVTEKMKNMHFNKKVIEDSILMEE